ncbi:class I SAM-dependent methyltransferase [Candidatus Woesearchaeota archaeon]|nr:class I SAM-dependent methyltransferase [Candidatus Woesearchaeota archaeon]
MQQEDMSERNYLLRYDQYAAFEYIIGDEYEKIGGVLASAISNHFKRKSRIHCLDVGCGTGKMPLTLLRMLQNNEVSIKFDYLDPSPQALAMYEATVPKISLSQRIQGDWASIRPQEATQQYDLILANNALCGMDVSDDRNLTKFTELLSPNGLALITLPSKRSDWSVYARMFWESTHGSCQTKTRFEDISGRLDDLHIPHQDSFVNAPVILGSDSDLVLRTVFGVMMYLDVKEIDTKFKAPYQEFKSNILSRDQPKLDFIYGIAELRK